MCVTVTNWILRGLHKGKCFLELNFSNDLLLDVSDALLERGGGVFAEGFNF